MNMEDGLKLIDKLIKKNKQRHIDITENMNKMSIEELEKTIEDLKRSDLDLEFLTNTFARMNSLVEMEKEHKLEYEKMMEEFGVLMDNIELYFRE